MSVFDAQLGIKQESEYNTPVAVDAWYEFLKETVRGKYERLESAGLRSGRKFARSDRWLPYLKECGGDIEFDVLSTGFETLLSALLGGWDDTSALSPGVPGGVKRWVATADSFVGRSFTVQVGRPDVEDTVYPCTYGGGKVTDFEISNDADGLLVLSTAWDFASEQLGTGAGALALQTADYPDGGELFSFLGGTVKVDDDEFFTHKVSVKVDNGLKTDRHFISQADWKGAAIEDTPRKIEWELEAEFDGLDQVNRVASATVDGATASLHLVWQAPTVITGSTHPQVIVDIPCGRFDDEIPTVDGAKLLDQKLSGVGLDNGTDEPITITYITAD